MVKSIGFAYRELTLLSQHPHDGLQASITAVTGGWMPSCLGGHHIKYLQASHSHTQKNKYEFI